MLVLVSAGSDRSPEDLAIDFSFEPVMAGEDTSAWSGHPLTLRGVLRDGTQVSLGLNMTECAQVFLAMEADALLHEWLETMQVLRAGVRLS